MQRRFEQRPEVYGGQQRSRFLLQRHVVRGSDNGALQRAFPAAVQPAHGAPAAAYHAQMEVPQHPVQMAVGCPAQFRQRRAAILFEGLQRVARKGVSRPTLCLACNRIAPRASSCRAIRISWRNYET